MTISRHGALKPLKMQPAKRFNDSKSQNQRDESLPQVVLGAYDPNYDFDDASHDKNSIPQVRNPGAQIPGI